MSGIDKVFDYLVPEALRQEVDLGARVRVSLNGRKVGGWIVDLTTTDQASLTVPLEKLSPLLRVSGHGVEPSLVPLTKWMSEEFFGSWRASLSRASAPSVTAGHIYPRHGRGSVASDDIVSKAVLTAADKGGGLVVVPPAVPIINSVAALASRGPVLVVCPTLTMAQLGAASLRRKGFTTAVVPEEWHHARAGVDVVIGARSAALAPCANLSAIVVIDEHDELHHDERSPTWNSVSVARRRAIEADVPHILFSALPSPESLTTYRERTTIVGGATGWPRIVVEDLADVPVAGSLLSSSLLTAVGAEMDTTVCVLNTKGKARLIVCKSCKKAQSCTECGSLLSQDDSGLMVCERCVATRGSVCVFCGRLSFSVARGGVSQLVAQLRKSTRKEIVEITADSQESWIAGNVFVGTEAVLFRVPQANTVVFADIDRDLAAPRVTATREVGALILRACRLVGPSGTVIIQTRSPQHPLLLAFAANDPTTELLNWCLNDIKQRDMFSLPPFSAMAHLSLSEDGEFGEIPDGVTGLVATSRDGILLKNATRQQLSDDIALYRSRYGNALRVHADPTRY